MNEQILQIVADELARVLTGGTLTRIFQLAASRLALDLRAPDNRLLFLSVEPARLRAYLIRRPLRPLEKEQLPLNSFAQLLRKHLGGARLSSVTKDSHDRVLRFDFRGHVEAGEPHSRTLVAQLTGRSANLFLLAEDSRILDTLRPARSEGQEPGDVYRPPTSATPHMDERDKRRSADELTARVSDPRRSPSEVLDEHDLKQERVARFHQRATAELARVRRELQKLIKLIENLQTDLRQHGDPEAHKRAGDLLLANLASAERTGDRVRLTDYFADGAPRIELEVPAHKTLQEVAAELFSRYAKAKRARAEINTRLADIEAQVAALELRAVEIDRIIAGEDEDSFNELTGEGKDKARSTLRNRLAPKQDAKRHPSDHIPGTRRYRSSDNFEIIVGRGARENDQLTFRVARPNDLWLHAADYPGAHVIVRNHTRAEIPHRTIVEAAQLAAHTSQAKADAKVSVNYTPRKFISKPKGAAPGLVRLSNFKTLLVEPREAGERTN